MLDCFSYQGGFALTIARRCEHVEAIDMAPAASKAAEGQAPVAARLAANPPVAVPTSSILYVGGFASPHSTLANFAFGDGSARGLTATMDPRVLQQLGHRADGKLLDAIDR